MNKHLTLFIAIVRYMVISRPTWNRNFTLNHARITVVLAVTLSVVYSIPYWLILRVYSFVKEETGDICHQLTFDNILSQTQVFPLYFVYDIIWMLLLACFCVLIIVRLRRVNQICMDLTSDMRARVKQQRRITIMLLAMMVTSMVTTLPLFAYVIKRLTLSESFFDDAITNMIMFGFTINSSINFVYYLVSKKFRETFLSLFLRMKINNSKKSVTKDVNKGENGLNIDQKY